MRVKAMGRLCAFIALGFSLLIFWHGSRIQAQTVISKREQSTLGSVAVGNHSISVTISYQADSALLAIAVQTGGHGVEYIPLIGTTYRGMPTLRLDVLSPDSGDEIWVKMSAPRSEMLAHYRFGSKTAITQFGDVRLLASPFPEHLSGGPIPFPIEGQTASRIRASFYLY